MKQRDIDKKELEQKILFNVNNLLSPYLEKLSVSPLDNKQKSYLMLIKSNLENITSSFISETSESISSLTPAELHVADLVKQGLTTIEISQVLCLAPATISAHRRNIRKKLGLVNQKKNLRTILSR
jgi:DNA-binding CsgD family transcriptional regulator